MSEESLLEALARSCGIVAEYHDIWGQPRPIGPETRRRLLADMGLRVETEADLQRELAEREAAPWRRPLPPVLVVSPPVTAARVPLVLPAEAQDRRFVLHLRRERGSAGDLPFVPAELPGGESREVDGEARVRREAPLPGEPEPGYHRLELLDDAGATVAATSLIVAPPTCYLPEGVAGEGRVWGPAVQLYGMRSDRNWGMGDFSDLEALVGIAGEAGAGLVGVNPLHALFPANPAHASPYSPSSRNYLNPLYLNVEAIPDFAECEEAREEAGEAAFLARVTALREAARVDYPGVAEVKREVLERLYRHFRTRHLEAGSPRGGRFRAFVAAGGETLAAYSTFCALDENFRAGGAWGWPVWPEPFRRPDTPEVIRFAQEHRERLEWFQYLEWEADRQLGRVGRRSLELGLKVGLYQDLAVGVDRAGFETWYHRELHAPGAGLGAPPDDFNLQGQNWGLSPWIPERLREAGYRPFIDALRAAMRHAGALRIDHVMGLFRAFWVPGGRPATEGAYVIYPHRDLLGILALESVRNRCLVIGEDLGTVPDAVRSMLAPLGVLSYRLLFFQKQGDGSFLPPEGYPRQSLTAVTTHDLPTLAGWWEGHDISLRNELDLFPDPRLGERQVAERSQDRSHLLFALDRGGLLPPGIDLDLSTFPARMTPELALAVHRYVAGTPSMLLSVQLEDVLGVEEQANLPGTTDQHPNWQRKLPLPLEALATDPRFRDLAEALRHERGEGRIPRTPGRSRPISDIPRATYRLQFNRDFTFAAAADLVPYLARLGVSHCYASPFLLARPGSRHGYDIIDHDRLNPEIGTDEDFQRLVSTLHEHDMGLVLDLVPNHMGVGSDNGWWMSVLEHGPASPFAAYFDIDWRPHKAELRGKVLLPVLEDQYGKVLEAGLLRLEFLAERGEFEVVYRDRRFPVDPRTYPLILAGPGARSPAPAGEEASAEAEFHSLVTAFANLPGREETAAEAVATRLRDAVVHKGRLAELAAGSERVASFIAARVARLDGVPGNPSSVDALDALLAAQGYRLAYWRTASHEINYRRFFDINDLARLRVEDARTFEATHRFVLELVRRGRVDGIRIDHPDGLYDPVGYTRHLEAEAGGAGEDGRPRIWTVAEKVLAAHERLPEDWAVHGTTGYDFCNLVLGLCVDGGNERALDRIYHRFVGRRMDCDRLLHDAKRLILETALSSELTALTDELNGISEADRRTRDFTHERLRQALAEVIAYFPVYRTYITGEGSTELDRRHVEWAVALARRDARAADATIFDFLGRILLLEAADGRGTGPGAVALERFVRRFQQTTAPVMAKGLEDTTFYIYNRLLALNEVGGDPRRFGVSVAAFHRANRERAERWPHAMVNTSTHDSKWSEDARLRLAALSELPEDWGRAVRRWNALNRGRKRQIHRRSVPDRNEEYALYQALLAVWPAGAGEEPPPGLGDRIRAWVVKALREAKVHSSWINPDSDYEEAVVAFAGDLLAEPGGSFLREFLPFQRRIAAVAGVHGLSQVLLKLTVPGVPDIYQGQEVPELTLVDPDNRRAVDFDARRRWLEELEARFSGKEADRPRVLHELAAAMEDGRAKLWVVRTALDVRRRRAELFRHGSYLPLAVDGSGAERLCAFARIRGGDAVVVVVPRLVGAWCDPDRDRVPVGPEVWKETRIQLPPGIRGPWREVFSGVVHPEGPSLGAARVLTAFPVALLEPEGAEVGNV